MLFDPQEKQIIISRDVMFDEKGIYQLEHVQIELRKDELVINDESISNSGKENEFKINPKCLVKSHSESNMLDINFERRVTISQITVDFSLMAQVMDMDEPRSYQEATRKNE